MIIICIIIIFILVYLIYQKEKKIKNISKQVNEILFQQKDLYVKTYYEGSLSILESEIVKLVNRLYEQNHLLQQDQLLLKQSLEDISHQMKTPLTALNLVLERLNNADEKERKKLLKEESEIIYKLEWLVSSLLKMAQLDANTITLKKEKINQKIFIEKILKPFEIQLELKNIEVIIETEENDIRDIDILWTLEAISNIVKNCIEHLDENGQLFLNIKSNPLYDEIIIQDNGKGINQEDLKHLFERFYKGKNANHKSVGIGLALTRMIVEKQNGTITVENTYPGAKFTIHFYKEVV